MKPLLYDIFVESITSRAKTKIYRIIIIWLTIFHIDLIYFALFVNEDLVFRTSGQLKNEYIITHFLNVASSQFWILEFLKFIIAIGIGCLAIYLLPRLVAERTYSREVEDDERLQLIKLRSESKIQKKRKQLTDEELAITNKELTVQEKQANMVKSETETWKEDYDEFKKSQMFNNFDDIVDSIIDHYGRIRETDINDRPTWWIDKQLLAYASGNDLVDLDQSDASISLTDKGKYFVKLYQLDTQTK
jgi:hypothetical protein